MNIKHRFILPAVIALSACADQHVEPVQGAQRELIVPDPPPVPGDPWGHVSEDPAFADGGPGTFDLGICSNSTAALPVAVTGFSSAWSTEGATDPASLPCMDVYASCDYPCDSDAACPIPGTGTARPTCDATFHTCWLTCGDGESCPQGLTCVDTSPWGLTTAEGVTIPPRYLCMSVFTECWNE